MRLGILEFNPFGVVIERMTFTPDGIGDIGIKSLRDLDEDHDYYLGRNHGYCKVEQVKNLSVHKFKDTIDKWIYSRSCYSVFVSIFTFRKF